MISQDKLKQQQQEYLNDKTIYTYCGILLPFSTRVYSYRTEDETIQIGDTVIVPVGEEDEKKTGTVVSIGQYARVGVPYPVEKTKFICSFYFSSHFKSFFCSNNGNKFVNDSCCCNCTLYDFNIIRSRI